MEDIDESMQVVGTATVTDYYQDDTKGFCYI